MVEWFDETILNWFLMVRNPALTPILRLFTVLGEGGAIWIALGILLLARRETRRMGMAVLLSLVFCLLAGNLFLKLVVARPRPCWRHPEIDMLIGIPRDYSFPSGHTMSSFAAAVSVFLWDRRWGLAALAGAAVIAGSRMYFYVHYPTDVLAGAVIGIILAILAKMIIDKANYIMRRKQRGNGGNHGNEEKELE